MQDQTEPINLFWTGGWDSTFRLIRLVFVNKKTVHPYYIIDPGRNSTSLEIKAMTNIKKALIKKRPEIEDLILPTIFKELNQIQPNQTITESYKLLTVKESIGIQYDWLARFCADEGINNMEICNETAVFDEDNRTRKLLGDDLDKFETEYGVYYKLNENAKGKDIYLIYGNFNFPVFDFTKQDMFEYGKKFGFDDVMKLTWFCHTPTKKNNPCGKCHPCEAVYREGLKWRLPLSAKLRYHTWPILRRIKKAFEIK